MRGAALALAFLAALVGLTQPLAAQRRAASIQASPALWVVSDADTTIYLFGTFHFLSPRMNWFDGRVRIAFEASSELVLEAIIPDNPAEMTPIVYRYAVDPARRPLSGRIDRREWNDVRRAIGPRLADAMDEASLEPWLYSLSITNHIAERLGLTAEAGADRVLQREARRRDMPISALETVDGQFRLYDRISTRNQFRGLTAALADAADPHRSFRPMLDAWASGDVARLTTILDARIDEPEVRRAVFTSRNTAWAGWIEERLHRPGTLFMAVGIGHLVGADSVADQLARRGIVVRRVETSP